VEAAGVPAERITLVPNASDLELFSPALDRAAARERLGLGDGFVCSYFGTLGEANDLAQVVRAAPLVSDVTFVLQGDGKQRAALESEARALGAANVVFLPPAAAKEDVARLAAASDACLTIFRDLPVLATNSPNKLFDTFAAGRPAIVNQPGWMRELVERNEAGLYARAGDPADLAAKVAWLRDHPGEAARFGRNARALAEREFGRDELAARALAVLEEAAS
jgi:glycosyltransferase involved in cell wall biosynthesis